MPHLLCDLTVTDTATHSSSNESSIPFIILDSYKECIYIEKKKNLVSTAKLTIPIRTSCATHARLD